MENRDHFRFQDFQIDQTDAPFKVGTDAVLLAAWVEYNGVESILEPGSGTGVISAIAMQRFSPKLVQTIELNPIASALTEQNIRNINSSTQHEHFEGNWLDFTTENKKPFDLILCNPPYFENATVNPDKGKREARHAEDLSLKSLLTHSHRIAHEKSILAVIAPADQVDHYQYLATENGWFIRRIAQVMNRPGSSVKRAMVEYVRDDCPAPTSEIITLRNTDNSYTDQYLKIVKGLYLFA